MSRINFFLTFINALLLSKIDGARILCMFPIPAISHQSVFRIYTQELARQGHELVIITPEPAYPKEEKPKNIQEIDVKSASYETLLKMLEEVHKKGLVKRGVILDVETYTDDAILSLYTTLCAEQFKHPEVIKLLEDKNQHFDLLVIEAITEYPLILSHFFKAPVIIFSSFYGTADNYETVGAVSRHPMLYPQCHRINFGNLNIWEKVKELYWEWRLMNFYAKARKVGHELLKEQFGPDVPSIDELKSNVDMLFVNSHPIFDSNRPVPPSVVYLGALHMKPVKDIPKDLKDYLDNSKRGVVFVSLGTNVRTNDMDKDLLDHFLNAFEKLPYDILWKFDGDSLDRKPKNLRIQKWFPQRDLLMHPNVKAFITQGGLQSIDEAIDAAVPMVGIPFIGDQWYNIHKVTELGVGVKLDAYTLSEVDIVKAVTTVVKDDSFKRNISALRSVMLDQPETPLQRAVWWTEHVLRHGGAKHLRSPAHNMSWSEYLMLDVLLPIFAILAMVISFGIALTLYLIRSVFRPINVKLKQQ